MGNNVHLNRFSFRGGFRYHFYEKKLNTVFGYVLLSVIGLLVTYGTVVINPKIGPVVIILFSVILMLVTIMQNPYFGFYFLIALSSVTIVLDRVINLPFTTNIFIDILTYYNFLTIFLKYELKKNIDLRFWSNPITLGMFVLFGFYIVELFNPQMFSQVGWFSFFRKQTIYFLFFYMCYCLLDSRERIIFFIRFMITLTTLLALYACKQQWFGYAGFELRSIGTGAGLSLLFQAGMLRKFSVFSDPATSGILFACICMISIVLYIRSTRKKEKWCYAIAAIINLLGYSYSGTRTATLMIISGILLYGVATLNERRTILFLIYSTVVFTLLIVMPYQNVITNRIRSTFEGTNDASAAIRDYDRHEVQPYIQEHPLGGGVFTCGFEGPKYNQGHYLEFLQPDSGYMKTLAEQGAIGLALLLIFYFVVMRQGFHHFFRLKDPELRDYYIGLLVMMFSLLVGQYSQMAITQNPIALFFYATMVIFIKLADFDKGVQPVKQTIQN